MDQKETMVGKIYLFISLYSTTNKNNTLANNIHLKSTSTKKSQSHGAIPQPRNHSRYGEFPQQQEDIDYHFEQFLQ